MRSEVKWHSGVGGSGGQRGEKGGAPHSPSPPSLLRARQLFVWPGWGLVHVAACSTTSQWRKFHWSRICFGIARLRDFGDGSLEAIGLEMKISCWFFPFVPLKFGLFSGTHTASRNRLLHLIFPPCKRAKRRRSSLQKCKKNHI